MPTRNQNPSGRNQSDRGQPGQHQSARNQSGDNTRNDGRGFAGMDDDKQRRIAQKGGEAVSENRQHMSDIGRKGGEASGGNRGGNR